MLHALTAGLLGYSSMPSWYELPRVRRAGPAWPQMTQVHASRAHCLMAHQAQRLIDKYDAPQAPTTHRLLTLYPAHQSKWCLN